MSRSATLPKSWTKQEKIDWWQNRITEIKIQLSKATAEREKAKNRVLKLAKRMRDANQAIYDLRHTESSDKVPSVTDHAVVRYMQRKMGVDINEIKIQIAKEKDVVMDGNVIITVLEDYLTKDK